MSPNKHLEIDIFPHVPTYVQTVFFIYFYFFKKNPSSLPHVCAESEN
jgi:hypothetical protein